MDSVKTDDCSSDLPTITTHSMSSTESQGSSSQQSTKVAIRIRPLNESEIRHRRLNQFRNTAFRLKAHPAPAQADPSAWTIVSTGNTDMITQTHVRKFESKSVFTFDKIFNEEATTGQVYHDLIQPIVKEAFRGRHGTVFCYGQTGSGKTYTMQGNQRDSEDANGVVQMAATDLFHWIEGSSREFIVRVTFVEVYNERVLDLLGKSRELQVREGSNRGIGVDAREVVVDNMAALMTLLHLGNSRRASGATKVNEQSSRSHAIFRITVQSQEKDDSGIAASVALRVATLNLVDLAGSENGKNAKLADSCPIKQRESGMINQSLSALSQVVQALSLPPNKRPTFINYRGSKLTRILQPYLSGNALMTILCCITPSELYIEQTRSTLRFASSAKLLQTNATVNEVFDETAIIKKLQTELARVRIDLADKEEREKSLNNALADARLELKKFKTMIFGKGNIPELEKVANKSARTSHKMICIVGSKDSNPSGTPEPHDANDANDPRSENVDEKMSLAKGFFLDAPSTAPRGDDNSTSTVKLDIGDFRRVTSRTRTEYTDYMVAVGSTDGPPNEVVIMMSTPSLPSSEGDTVNAQVNQELEQRALFLHSHLESAEDLIESLVHEVESARMCVRQLVYKNMNLAEWVQKLRRKLTTTEEAKDSLHKSQYILLKYCIYISLFFFLFGCQELFLACGLFLWLTLEVTT